MSTTATTDISQQVSSLRAAFDTGRTRPLAWRRTQLRALAELCRREEARLLDALRADLGKPEFEAYTAEVGFLVGEVQHTLKHLRRWTRPEKVSTPLLNFKGRSAVHREPLGVVLIIGPWNYPIQLLLAPLVGALAAGNCALLKPSEVTPTCSALIAELVPNYLDADCVAVVEGGVPETTELLAQRFDSVFFTGSTRVGRIVYEAAAKHLTPVTLELGGKSPCIVDRDVDLEVAARRIVWGKFFNAGQTCVAPDYVLVDRVQEEALLDAMSRTIEAFYGSDPLESPDLARIVNERHFERLVAFFADGDVVVGGRSDRESLRIAPTILRGVSPDAPVMGEEIFGPVLPVLPVDSMREAIDFVRARPKPLALYVFARDRAVADRVLSETSSGGACVNDTVSHLVPPDLPFGGVGASGFGAYHGRATFETFSHRKSVFDRSTRVDLRLRYPPYEGALKWVKKLLG
ncbi:MAG: aldehyde dehydrogenase family protein [Planctomycetota bacterium]|nr:MAG: aldehyde dehydrogenase family protein [Planctomycetota bacterium]